MIVAVTHIAEKLPVPDFLIKGGVEFFVERTRRSMRMSPPMSDSDFIGSMSELPIAIATDAANRQHYELPPEFFERFLGPRRKYSCCYYCSPDETLARAELNALELTAAHADVRDGQSILELGCGWGSFSLWAAARFPNARITAVSNSSSQRAHIESEARQQGLRNLKVLTADMNEFDTAAQFERIVSIEMFEHIANWRLMLDRATSWLRPDGLMFLHVFTHRTASYRFAADDPDDWIGRYFFTGGMMPSHGLIHGFDDIVRVDAEWRWNGWHYARTAYDWLRNFDSNAEAVRPLLLGVYGDDALIWRRRWRLFLLATAGLFGNSGGAEWGVSHYRLRPTR